MYIELIDRLYEEFRQYVNLYKKSHSNTRFFRINYNQLNIEIKTMVNTFKAGSKFSLPVNEVTLQFVST